MGADPTKKISIPSHLFYRGKVLLRSFFAYVEEDFFGLNRNRRSSPSLLGLPWGLSWGFLTWKDYLPFRHSKTLWRSAWELPTGGRPSAQAWICLALTEFRVIASPNIYSTARGEGALPHSCRAAAPTVLGAPGER